MARALIVTVQLTRTALTLPPTATVLDSVNGNYCQNDGATFLWLSNGAGVTRTVSVEVPEDVDADLPVSSRTFTLLAGQAGYTGIFPRQIYGSQLLVDVSGATVSAVAYSTRI